MAKLETRYSGLLERIGPARVEFLELKVVVTPDVAKRLLSDQDAYFREAIQGAGLKVNGYITNDDFRKEVVSLVKSNKGKLFGIASVRAHVLAPPQHKSKIINIVYPRPYRVTAKSKPVELKRVGSARADLELLTLDPNRKETSLINKNPAKYFTEFYKARGRVVNKMFLEDGPILTQRKPVKKSAYGGALRGNITIYVHIIEGAYASVHTRVLGRII